MFQEQDSLNISIYTLINEVRVMSIILVYMHLKIECLKNWYQIMT